MDNAIQTILKDFNAHRRLANTLTRLSKLIEQQALYAFSGDVDDIRRNYDLMLDFMRRGYTDERRNDLYDEMIGKTYRLIQNIQVELKKKDNPSYHDAAYRLASSRIVFDPDAIRQRLEDHVADMAMLSLEAPESREEHRRQLLQAHDAYMGCLFDHILLSNQWHDADASFYRMLLTSPAIDTVDAQWIVGAIMLACVNVFDLKKLEVLAAVYVADVAESVRQRALVGWALSLDGNQTLMVEGQKRTVDMIVEHDKGVEQLKEMQIQLMTSVNALYDDECIKRDIMPTLLKQGNMDLAQLSKDITQSSDLHDILHPEDSENMMSEVETVMNRMKEMAAKGRDIYYGGFCQAKRYSFFSKLSHWFEPFFWDNPSVDSGNAEPEDAREVIKSMLSALPFCDNDKYSFVILFSKMMTQLPANLRKVMIENKGGVMPMAADDMTSASFIRRNYLHDLFRFHQLYAMKDNFVDCFRMRQRPDVVNVFVADDRLFGDTDGYKEMCYDALRFMDSMDTRKDEHYRTTVLTLLAAVPMPLRLSDRLFVAHYLWQHGDKATAATMYDVMVAEYPDNEYVLRGAAHSRLDRKDYLAALSCYDRLAGIHEDNVSYLLNRSLCLVMSGRVEEAMPTLHKLYYNNPDNMDVVRVMLWGMMNQGNSEQAVAEYEKLCAKCPDNADDRLNYGYSLWLSGRVAEAVEVFRAYLTMAGRRDKGISRSIYSSFEADISLLQSQGIDVTAMHLMADAVDVRPE